MGKREKTRFKSWNFGKMVGNGKTDIYSKSNPEIGEVWPSLDMFCRWLSCGCSLPFWGIQKWQKIQYTVYVVFFRECAVSNFVAMNGVNCDLLGLRIMGIFIRLWFSWPSMRDSGIKGLMQFVGLFFACFTIWWKLVKKWNMHKESQNVQRRNSRKFSLKLLMAPESFNIEGHWNCKKDHFEQRTYSANHQPTAHQKSDCQTATGIAGWAVLYHLSVGPAIPPLRSDWCNTKPGDTRGSIKERFRV